MTKLIIIYLNHPYTCLNSVQSFYLNNIAELLWYVFFFIFAPLIYLTRGVVQSEYLIFEIKDVFYYLSVHVYPRL